MKYTIEVKKSILPDKIKIFNSNGESKYEIITKKFSVGRQIMIKNTQKNEEICIKESALSFAPKYQIVKAEKTLAEVSGTPKNKMSTYFIDSLKLTIKGNMKKMDFTIFDDSKQVIGIVTKNKNNCYEVEVDESNDELLTLAIILSVHCLKTTDEVVYGGTAF